MFRVLGPVALFAVLSGSLSACTSGQNDPVADGTILAAPTASEVASELELLDGSGEIFCDDTDRPVGQVSGAEPGEKITVSSPRPIELSAEQIEATADADGTYELTWSCGSSEVGQPWELRLEGQDSGRRLTMFLTGTSIDPDAIDVLQATMFEEAVTCDGRLRDVGELSNATAWEPITFSADDADNLTDGDANSEGVVTVRWQCSPDEATTWTVTARGIDSERVGVFNIVGVAPTPKEIPTPTVEVVENPFQCDGGSRVFATLSGFLDGEPVDFSSPQAASVSEGVADDAGDLPLRWTCTAGDADTVWELTAAGRRSQRTVSFTLTGTAAPPLPDPTVTLTENPFLCDGATRFAAALSGFTPREFVDFTSPQAENLRQGQADESGALQVRWTCDIDDVGQTWDITATGVTSQLMASLQITGAAPKE